MFSAYKLKPDSKPVVILPLGILFVPNDPLAFGKLADLVGKENQANIPKFYEAAKIFINQFKQGELSEENFDHEMLKLISTVLKTKITIEQFNTCWLARYHDKSIKDLKSVTAESKLHDYTIYSFTNPKDKKEIERLCQEKKIDHTVTNGHLEKIQGIDVRDTFTEKMSKVDLFKTIAKEKYEQGLRDIHLIIGSEDGQTIPMLKEEAEKLNNKLSDVAKLMNIHVIKVDPNKPLDMTTLLQQEKQTIVCKL